LTDSKYKDSNEINPTLRIKHIDWLLKKANIRPKPAKERAYPNTQAERKVVAN